MLAGPQPAQDCLAWPRTGSLDSFVSLSNMAALDKKPLLSVFPANLAAWTGGRRVGGKAWCVEAQAGTSNPGTTPGGFSRILRTLESSQAPGTFLSACPPRSGPAVLFATPLLWCGGVLPSPRPERMPALTFSKDSLSPNWRIPPSSWPLPWAPPP